ncbi:hypothetical protein B0H14DRAFT_2609658 [Mycena olivaceomarginata]|nr:hypothetical protein B0H14DRAFT_2609658 [Mycena olivaceomarginata]
MRILCWQGVVERQKGGVGRQYQGDGYGIRGKRRATDHFSTGAKPLNPNSGPHQGASIRTAAPGHGHRVTITIARFPRPDDIELGLSLRHQLHPSPSAITQTTQVYRIQVLSIPHCDGFKFSCVCSLVSRTWNGIHYLIENIPASNSSLTAKAKVRIGMLLFTPTDFDFDFSFELRKPKCRLHIIQLVVQNSNAVSDAGKHFLLCDTYMSMKNQDHEELYSSKKQSCRATAATRKTHMHPSWNRVWGSTSQDLKSRSQFRSECNQIQDDYRTSKSITARARCALGVGVRRDHLGSCTGELDYTDARRSDSCITSDSGGAFGAIAAARESMGVGSWQRRYPSLVRVARVLTSILWCICARVPKPTCTDRALAHTRRLRNRALGSPHVALPDSCIVQGCALRVVHVLHPFDPPRHKSSSAHCASSARHVLRRTAPTRTRLGGGHGVRISSPDLGPALLGRRQMEETLHFWGFSNQGYTEVSQQTWTHLGLGRKMPGIKSFYGATLKT